jgi:predicted PurR-regulated permease PerM
MPNGGNPAARDAAGSAAAVNAAGTKTQVPGRLDAVPPESVLPESALPESVPLDAVPSARLPEVSGPPSGPSPVPDWLQTAGAWSWRLLLLGIVIYVLARITVVLYIVVVPFAGALLLTALLQPLAARLRRAGFGPMSATWCTFLLAIFLLAGAAALVTARVQAEYPSLVAQVKHTSAQVQRWLSGPPFHLHTASLQKLSGNVVSYLGQHKTLIEGTVVTGGRIVVEVLAGVVLMFFITFFLIKDGARIWAWLTSGLRPERRLRVDRAGRAAWQSVVHYTRGTICVAAIHAVVMGVTLSVINAPLVVPLALLMFVAAFVPLVGALVAGFLAILVVLAAKGWIAAVVVLGILIVMNQLESHLLQPQVVGKMVHLHPLAVILVLAVGVVLAGIFGGVIAVPLTAGVTSALPELRRRGPTPPLRGVTSG